MSFSIDTVFVWVTDLDRSVHWYSSFGIEAGPGYGNWQPMVVDGEVTFALHKGARTEGPSTGGIAFRVANLDVEIARLAAEGIDPADSEITDTGAARFTTYRDQDGNDVQLLER